MFKYLISRNIICLLLLIGISINTYFILISQDNPEQELSDTFKVIFLVKSSNYVCLKYI